MVLREEDVKKLPLSVVKTALTMPEQMAINYLANYYRGYAGVKRLEERIRRKSARELRSSL